MLSEPANNTDPAATVAPVAAAPRAAPDFGRVRVRWLPLWAIVGGMVLVPFAQMTEGQRSDGRGQFIVYLGISAALALWTVVQCKRARIRVRDLLGPRPRDDDWRLIVMALPLLPLALGAVWLVWLPISYALPDFVQQWILKEDPAIWTSDAPLRSVLVILTMVVVAPIAEEFVFRGVLLQRFAAKWGQVTAVTVTSVLFGMMHADVLGKTIFGIVMAMLYVRTRGLWLPIACHALNNALAVMLSLVPMMKDKEKYGLAEFRADWYVGAIALVVAVWMLYALRDRIVPPPGWRLPVPGQER